MGDCLRLSYFGDNLVVVEHLVLMLVQLVVNNQSTDPDLKVFAADDQLVQAVLVVVCQHKGGHIVPSHRPEWVVSCICLYYCYFFLIHIFVCQLEGGMLFSVTVPNGLLPVCL